MAVAKQSRQHQKLAGGDLAGLRRPRRALDRRFGPPARQAIDDATLLVQIDSEIFSRLERVRGAD
jgi:hypothetical protein